MPSSPTKMACSGEGHKARRGHATHIAMLAGWPPHPRSSCPLSSFPKLVMNARDEHKGPLQSCIISY